MICQCGCGQKTNIIKHTVIKKGYKVGEYYRFLPNHGGRVLDKRFNRQDEATGCCVSALGEIRIYDKSHPKVKPGRMIPEAHLIVEAALGNYLPQGACVLHVDKDPSGTKMLVACENKKYMQLLRQRIVAYEKCGHANYRKCGDCGEYDDPLNMVKRSERGFRHKSCKRGKR